MPPFRKPHSRRGGRSTRRGRFCTPAVSRRHRAPRVPPARTLPSRSRRPNRSVSLRSRPVSLGTGNSRRRHRGCSSGGAPCRHGPRLGLASTPPVASGRAGRRALRRRRVGHRAPRPRTQPGRVTALTRSPAVACARAMCRAEGVAPARGSPLGLPGTSGRISQSEPVPGQRLTTVGRRRSQPWPVSPGTSEQRLPPHPVRPAVQRSGRGAAASPGRLRDLSGVFLGPAQCSLVRGPITDSSCSFSWLSLPGTAV